MATATPARSTVPANGAKPEGKPVSTKTEGIDLSLDPADLKLNVPSDGGAPSILTYFAALHAAVIAAETIEEKCLEVNRAAAKRLHDANIASVRIHEGKSVGLDSPHGKLYRVRGVNGSPNTYQLYGTEPKARKKGASVDIDTL